MEKYGLTSHAIQKVVMKNLGIRPV
jgi:hypothetical protein